MSECVCVSVCMCVIKNTSKQKWLQKCSFLLLLLLYYYYIIIIIIILLLLLLLF